MYMENIWNMRACEHTYIYYIYRWIDGCEWQVGEEIAAFTWRAKDSSLPQQPVSLAFRFSSCLSTFFEVFASWLIEHSPLPLPLSHHSFQVTPPGKDTQNKHNLRRGVCAWKC